MTASSSRRGFTAAEFVIVLAIFGVGVTTLYTLFWRTSEQAFRSKWAYLAAHAAREELESLRTQNLFGRYGSAAVGGHDWRPLLGSMVEHIAETSVADRDEFLYPDSYSRIETKVDIAGDPADRLLAITLSVRYQKDGADSYGLADAAGNALPIGTYRTVIVNRERR